MLARAFPALCSPSVGPSLQWHFHKCAALELPFVSPHQAALVACCLQHSLLPTGCTALWHGVNLPRGKNLQQPWLNIRGSFFPVSVGYRRLSEWQPCLPAQPRALLCPRGTLSLLLGTVGLTHLHACQGMLVLTAWEVPSRVVSCFQATRHVPLAALGQPVIEPKH